MSTSESAKRYATITCNRQVNQHCCNFRLACYEKVYLFWNAKRQIVCNDMEAKPIITCNRIRFLFKFNVLVSLNYSSSFKLVVLSCKLLISQTIRLGVMSSAYPWSLVIKEIFKFVHSCDGGTSLGNLIISD